MKRVILPITMELCSDTIFGSGFSVPGGEDVAVCLDEQGYPYVKGATLKGLLRESLENLVVWTGSGDGDVIALMGQKGWPGTEDGRRVRFTSLTLDDPPQDPEECCDLRTFTSLEGGIVKEGSLRTAACVRKGLVFSGKLTCGEEDVDLLRSALAGIKWAGTMRSRGFGSVRLWAGEPEALSAGASIAGARCIRCRLHTELPVIVTDLNRSSGNSFETLGFIPGSAIRGVVMGNLSAQNPEWFESHKKELLSVRFLDAVPALEQGAVLPSIKGFYAEKGSDTLEYNIVTGKDVVPGHKRAKLGSFCVLKDDCIRYWNARTSGTMRINRKLEDEKSSGQSDTKGPKTKPFQVRYLEAGQDFEGYILLEDPELSGAITEALGTTVWLGADRYAGFGKCSVTLMAADCPSWLGEYGYQKQEEITTDLYLLAVSPLTMLNERGDPCGLDEGQLARKLGVASVELLHCSTSITQNGSYNRVWQCRAPSLRMYDRGSLFHLKCSQPPALERVRQIQNEGLGVRRPEGFGQVLFLPPARLEGLNIKKSVEKDGRQETDSAQASRAAVIRRAKYKWVEKKTGELARFKLSKSQLGMIQVLCEDAIARGGDCGKLYDHLTHNLEGRGALHGERFKEIDKLVHSVLDHPLNDTIETVGCEDTTTARLELLCLLFNHSRKGKEET